MTVIKNDTREYEIWLLKCRETDVSAVAVDMIKVNEYGEFKSPKVAPESTEPMVANSILITIKGSVILMLINRIARGITVDTVNKVDPLKKLINDEKRKKINGIVELRVDPPSRFPMSELEKPSFSARDSSDIERMI